MSSTTNETHKPGIYHDSKAATALLVPGFLLILGSMLTVVLVVVGLNFLPQFWPLMALVAIGSMLAQFLVAKRVLWKWRNPHHCDPDNGRFVTSSRMNMRLGLPGSLDDVVRLDDVKFVDTPGSLFFSKYLNSSTLVLDDRVFKHVRNVQHILDIIKYRESMRSRGLAHTEKLVDLQTVNNEQQRTIISLLTQLVERLPEKELPHQEAPTLPDDTLIDLERVEAEDKKS